jgi:hypothetical protein
MLAQGGEHWSRVDGGGQARHSAESRSNICNPVPSRGQRHQPHHQVLGSGHEDTALVLCRRLRTVCTHMSNRRTYRLHGVKHGKEAEWAGGHGASSHRKQFPCWSKHRGQA